MHVRVRVAVCRGQYMIARRHVCRPNSAGHMDDVTYTYDITQQICRLNLLNVATHAMINKQQQLYTNRYQT